MFSWYFRRFRPVTRSTVRIAAPRLEMIEERINLSPSFTAGAPFAALPTTADPATWLIAPGDFNNDGKQDYISYGGFANTGFQVYLGNGDGTFTNKGVITVLSGIRTDTLSVADFCSPSGGPPDSIPDFAFVNTGNQTVDLWASQGDGTFFPISSTPADLTRVSMTAGDLTGDGAADLVIGRFGGGGPNGTAGEYEIMVNNNKGDGSFTTLQRTATNGLNEIFTPPVIADFNKDGKADFAATNATAVVGAGRAGVYYGSGDGKFSSGSILTLPGNTGTDDMVVGDFDGNGFKDVATLTHGATVTTFNVFYQSAAGVFAAPITFNSTVQAVDAVVADFDYDGRDDIAVTPNSTTNKTVLIYSGNADQTFTTSTLATAGTNSAIGVIDGDFNGTADLLVGTSVTGTQNFQFFANNNLPSGVQTTDLKVAASPSPSTYGNPVNFSATVRRFGQAPTGTVTFFVNGVSVGTGNVGANGVATLVGVGPYPVGNNTLTAVYAGDTNYNPLTAPNKTFVVNPLASTLTFTYVDQNTTLNNVYGETVTLNAKISKIGSFTPTGFFDFTANGVAIGSAKVSTTGTVVLTTGLIPAGTNTLTATYRGDAIYANNSIDAATTLFVEKQPTGTEIYTTQNTAVFGQPLDITVTVFNASLNPVIFNTTYAGVAVLYDNTNAIAILNIDASGRAMYRLPSDFAIGKHMLEAKYLGTSSIEPSTSAAFTQVITPAATTITLDAPANVPFGSSFTLSAKVAVTPPGVGSVEGGTVSFFQDGVQIATPIITSGLATFQVTDIAAGTYVYTAKYQGNDSTTGSTSNSKTVVVEKTNSATVLTVAPVIGSIGAPVTLTANVSTALGIPVNSGTITFKTTFNGFAKPDIVRDVVNGVATFTYPGPEFAAGTGTVTASYSGETSINGSADGPANFTVGKAKSILVLTTPNGTSAPLGSTVTFDVNIIRPTGVTLPLTGTVNFYDTLDGVKTLLDSKAVDDTGLVSTSAKLPLGDHTISAEYSGNENYEAVLSSEVFFRISRTSVGVGGGERFSVGIGSGGDDRVRLFTGDAKAVSTFNPLFAFSPDNSSGVRVATGDFNGDGEQDTVVGTGPGTGSVVKILSGKDGSPIASFSPFGLGFTGGVFVAAGDIDGDLTFDLVVTPDRGGGARVRAFTAAQLFSIDDNKVVTPNENPASFADFIAIIDGTGKPDTSFRGGARAALGDLNGDGKADVVVAAGTGGGPRIAGFNGATLTDISRPKLFGDFFAFESNLRNGSFIAVGDIDADGDADLVASAGPGGGARIKVFTTSVNANRSSVAFGLSSDFFVKSFGDTRSGTSVALRFLDADENIDLVVGSGPGQDLVTAYYGTNLLGKNTEPATAAGFPFNAFTNNTPDPEDRLRGVFVG